MRKVVLLAFPGVEALDLTAPCEVFAKAAAGPDRKYEVEIASVGGETVIAAESGLAIVPTIGIEHAAFCDTLVVPGGRGLREVSTLQRVSSWLSENHEGIRRIASVCTGAFGVAASGLFDGRRATTHWRFVDEFQELHPRIHLERDAIYVVDGKFRSSAGMLAGIDLSLAMIAEDCGAAAANDIARELVAYVRRPGWQGQKSRLLELQTRTVDLADVGEWIATNLDADLSLDLLAARACLSPRQFSRRFKAVLGASPAAHVGRLRFEAAQALLTAGRSLDEVARAVGARDSGGLRRLFHRYGNVTPAALRREKATNGRSNTALEG